jgi:hypothetical protein
MNIVAAHQSVSPEALLGAILMKHVMPTSGDISIIMILIVKEIVGGGRLLPMFTMIIMDRANVAGLNP